jgi:6-pyruvoyltetrahydropterin/6-carboxytetrahydropterin synthase
LDETAGSDVAGSGLGRRSGRIVSSRRRPLYSIRMEKIIVHAKFHTGHRQLGYPGKCKFVHGHTWRGTVTISTEAFPRDELDMSLDFGDIKDIMRDLDHRMLIVESDRTFMDSSLFEPEGVVILKGKGPSVENVAHYVYDHVVDLIRDKYPDRGIAYRIEVVIQETENNFFVVEKTVEL